MKHKLNVITIVALALVWLVLPQAVGFGEPPANYNSGISVFFGGEEGVDWTEEYFWHNKIEDDRKVVYIKAETPIWMEHNERNMRQKFNVECAPGKEITVNDNSFCLDIGINGEDGIPNSGDEGIIRYKVDRDSQLKYEWSRNPTGRQRYPAYTGSFTFNDLEYEPGVLVVGTTGGQGADPMDRENYYYAGQIDDFGDEWHTIAFADDDEWLTGGGVIGSGHEKLASDGKTILFVVNPKTPAISFKTLTADAQFYTTPAKAYWIPRVHVQTTYLTDNVEIKLVNIMGGNIYYRFDGGAFQLYTVPINSNALSNGEHILEYYYNHDYHKIRRIVKNPNFPSSGEEHGYTLWKNDTELNGIKARLQTGAVQGYQNWYNLIRASGDGAYNRNGHRTLLGEGKRIGSDKALENAFIALVEGMNYSWTGEQDSFAVYGKKMLLDNVRKIDPLWFGDPTTNPNPCSEINYRGYYDVNLIFSNAFAYDILIKDFKSTQYVGGITPIEDYKIRDSLARFALESMMQLGNYGSYGNYNNAEGMWGAARNFGALMVAIITPSYDTSYYGTSGFDATVATHFCTPYPDQPLTWKEAFYTETNPLYTYPNQSHRFFSSRVTAEGYYGPQILEGPFTRSTPSGYLEIPAGSYAESAGYFGPPQMGHVFHIAANVMKIKFNHTYPYMEMTFDYANKGTLYGLKGNRPEDIGPMQFPQLFLINERFPDLAEDAEAYMSGFAPNEVNSIWGQMTRREVYSLILYHNNWRDYVASIPGDVSGDAEISAFDAALAAHIAVDLAHPDIKNRAAAEVSGDGEVGAYDAALIAQKAVGLIDKFPVE